MDSQALLRDKRAKIKRRERLAAARQKGTHSLLQWERLKLEFGFRCVRCGTVELPVEKDHIIPLYQGGSDSIENIQPVCARCNANKGPEDFDWKNYRRLKGFQ